MSNIPEKNSKVYCSDCEYKRVQYLGLCESSIYWCHVFDEKIDNWWGVSVKGKIRCTKQNKNNDCKLFSHK